MIKVKTILNLLSPPPCNPIRAHGNLRCDYFTTPKPSPLKISVKCSDKQRNGVGQTVDIDGLRSQLDQLHAEAQFTRSKANSARLRLMRLTEAVENLQRSAANSVLVGKESEARELLIQKKKLLRALEKSKNRVELLDKLLTKINEAIGLKESQLIGQLAMNPDVTKQDSFQQIRFVSPKDNRSGVSNRNYDLSQFSSEQYDPEELVQTIEANLQFDTAQGNFGQTSDEKIGGSSKGYSSHDFLEHIDSQLRVLEADLEIFLTSDSFVPETKQKKMHAKSENILQILKDIVRIRERIASMLEVDDENNN